MITIDYKLFIRDREMWFFGYRFTYANGAGWRLMWNGGVTTQSFAIAEWIQERLDEWV